jgi:hypothetical protein
MHKLYMTMIACAGLVIGSLAGADLALAKDESKGPSGQDKQQEKQQDKGDKDQKKKAQKGSHKKAKDLLGAKLKQDGKHNVGKAGKHDVKADVKKGKVVDMTAGDLPAHRVKTKQKMAGVDGGLIRLASNGPMQIAQGYDDWYYGFCFDDGYDYYCYWYTADEVYYEDYAWDDYDPNDPYW